jgi:hypothetical protein
VDDDSLQEAIRESLACSFCDFCDREANELIAAPVDALILPILEGLQTEWADPVDELMYIGREGGYQGTVLTSSELLLWEIDPFSENVTLVKEVANLLDDYHWCKKDYGVLRASDALAMGWEKFCRKVKHETRYMFFEDEQDNSEPRWRHPDDVRPEEMLESVGYAVREVGLIRSVTKGETFVRARIDAPAIVHSNARALGPPPTEFALQSNRMSPAGIPMFYGAMDAETALAEVRSEEGTPAVATLGTWAVAREFDIVDLTQLPFVPSLFNRRLRHLRDPIIFLYNFVKDLAKPVAKDRYEHIEYVTEYFRYQFRQGSDSQRVLGIAYPSSRNPGGTAIVLFFTQHHCVDVLEDNNSSEKPYLVLEKDTLERVALP